MKGVDDRGGLPPLSSPSTPLGGSYYLLGPKIMTRVAALPKGSALTIPITLMEIPLELDEEDEDEDEDPLLRLFSTVKTSLSGFTGPPLS